MSVRTAIVLTALLLFCIAVSPAQMRRRGGTMGGRTSPNAGSPEAMSAAVATFEGTLRAVNKHNLLLEVGEGKTLTLIVDKKTLFRDGDNKVLKPAEMSPEAKATVEVHKVMGDLVAISVRLRGSDAHSQAAKPEMKHRN